MKKNFWCIAFAISICASVAVSADKDQEKKPAETRALLELIVSGNDRVGNPLPNGQKRITFVTTMNDKVWRPLVVQVLKNCKITIVKHEKDVLLPFNAQTGIVTTIDDIFVKQTPTFQSLKLLEGSGPEKVIFRVEGKIDPENLSPITEDLKAKPSEDGTTIVFTK